jgi:hypothetical protein
MCLVPLLRYVPVMARINRVVFLASRGLVSAVSHEISENWTIIHKAYTAMLSRAVEGKGFNETIRIYGMKMQTSSCQTRQTIMIHCSTVLFSYCWQNKFRDSSETSALWSISYPLVYFFHPSTPSKCEDFDVQASICPSPVNRPIFTATEFLISSQDVTRA